MMYPSKLLNGVRNRGTLPPRMVENSLLVRTAWLVPLLVLLNASFAHAQDVNGQVYGFVSFSTERVVVQEDSGNAVTTVQLPIIRELGTTGTVLATVEVVNSSVESDFFSTSTVVSFLQGRTTASAVLLLRNDAIPEGNETFIVNITGTRFGADIGPVNSLVLVVRANDEPYGDFKFSTGSRSVRVSESTDDSVVELLVERGPGTFGRVTIDYQVTSGPNNGINDLSPTQGRLVFSDRVANMTLEISVTADDIPENEESFTISLSNPTGGAGLASNGTEAVLVVEDNDTPIRFSQAQYTVEEDAGSVVLTITRGVLDDGTEIGNLTQETSVEYETLSGTAVTGIDFENQSGTVTFASGVTSQTIAIPITDDTDPEGDEIFSVSLSSPSSDAALSTPSLATVLIEVNDNAGGLVQFASAGPVVVDEDDGSTAEFTVQRLDGSFGNVTIEWQLVDSSEELATSDFMVTRNNFTIPDGENEAVIQIRPINDDTPEIAERFSLELTAVVSRAGELHPTGTRVASLTVEDSDNVYGLVELAADAQLSTTNDDPRQLHLAVTRNHGTIGTISVDYFVTYLAEGMSDPSEGDPSVFAMASGSVRLVGGQTMAEWDLEILDEAFLDTSAQFYVKLNSTSLVEGVVPLVTPTNSPRISSRSDAYISIPEAAANGYISFVQLSLSTQEVDSGFGGSLTLDLTRSGAYGRATITWRVIDIDTDSDDLGTSSGITEIENGATTASSSSQLVVVIINDDDPEIDERFEVELVSVAETSQRIDAARDTAVVTITLNDNADGIFTVSSSPSSYTTSESSDDVITITILRGIGALTTQIIDYQTVPGLGLDFIGGVGRETFSPGQTEATVHVLPLDDDIPENVEEFNFTISASSSDFLGSVTNIPITILANDEYAGVFSFTDSSLALAIDEPGLEGSSSTITLTIRRDRGTFTDVTVFWEVTTSSASGDISPTSGSVTFSMGQTTGTFTISALEDETPEDDLHYTVALTSVSGDGELASSSAQARLTVRHNDDPISLRDSVAEAREGEVLELVVTRGGHSSGVAEVSFEILYTSASSDDVIITPSSGAVTLINGQNATTIYLEVVDDATPEESEHLRLTLVSTTGDAVLVTPTSASITLLPSDDPNGVFGFAANSTRLTANEGETLQITIERLQGSFGTVELSISSYLLNSTTGERASADTSTDLSQPPALLVFSENETLATFALEIMDEDTPEFEERFELELSIESSDGDSEDGARLGSSFTSLLVVTENDDPHGLFAISAETNAVEVVEDVVEGEEGGSVEILVERRFGDSGYVQVNWELVPELDPPLLSFTDIFLLGSRGPAVTIFSSRNHTGTIALQFTGQADSVVTIASEDNPPIITNKLTISLWLRMMEDSSGGVLLTKTGSSGSTIFYGLEVAANGDDYLIRFSYLPASKTSGSESVEVSVPQSSLADGNWHSLTVVIDGSVGSFYQDASLINSRTLAESSIRDEAGNLTVGGTSGAGDGFFTAALQDVRVYAASLDQSQISAIATDSTAATLTPISGYLSYEDGDREFGISIATRDDSTPEPSTVFTLQLTGSNGGSHIESTASSSTVTVLKSDAANGVFGFDASSLSTSIDETASVSLTVQRLRGDYGSVTLHWEIRDATTDTLASTDFENAAGTLEFTEGDRQEMLVLQPLDETEPELDEMFAVFLVDAVSNDGFVSSTPTSGASIDTSLERSNLTVTENDYPYGLLQFSTTIPPATGLIPAASMTPELAVRESAGTVTIFIVRAQGMLGTISAEYLTRDGTATGTGVSPDYVSTAGSVEFGPDDRYVSVELTLVDDTTPELEKVFYVSLTNPAGDQGVPGLSIGRNITIRLLPSDDAFGLFSFAADSLSRLVSEEEGGTTITLNIERQGGTFDDVSVYWEVEGEDDGDISPVSGQVDFAQGEMEGELTVTVTNDQVPELEEAFTIRLVNATGGASVTTSGSQVATVSVRASDHPYGLFTFSPAFRPLGVSENVGVVEVMVTREFGDMGNVTVGYATVESGHSSLEGLVDVAQLQETSHLATPGDDYVVTSGTLTFDDGELMKSFSLQITNDIVPEVDEYIFVAITSVQLDPDSVEDVDNSVLPTSASDNGSLAFIMIGENDDARGVLELSSSTYEAEEPSQNFITVNRGAGTFGMVSVEWEAVVVTAQSSDFIPQSGTVQLAEGTLSVQLPLSIVDDSEPEFSETLSVTLTGASGGARIDGTLTATVTIPANDDPNGALEFAESSRSVMVQEPENSDTASISLVVERTGGDTGVVEVSWSISSNNGDDPSLDIVPVSGTLQFISNFRQQQIDLSVKADDIPEVEETFTISLSDVTGGARIGDAPSATVTILANDNPNGFIEFESPTFITTEEDSDTIAMVPVIRSAGLFGNISVLYSTASSPLPSATAGNDYTAVVGREIIIPEGSSLVYIPVTILADDLPELNETFQLSLIDVSFAEELAEDSGSGGPQLGPTTTADVLILENDDPYGRFSITGSGGESTVRVQEVGSFGVSLNVNREAGSVGTVMVTWSIAGGTATENVDYGGSGAVLSFDEDTMQRTISIIIFEDSRPERDEDIVISLSNPTGGAVLAGNGGSSVTVVIEANDNAAGIVGLIDSARSAIVAEGEVVRLGLERTVGNLGVVDVVWEISGSGNVSREFASTTGNATFQNGSSTAEIVFEVAADGIPELAEEYYLSLTSVHTVSDDISQMGAAQLDSDATMATLTLNASDNPHGVVEFQELSVRTQSEESSPLTLTVVREFGAIGALDVVYEAVMGSLDTLEVDTILATPGSDFNSSRMTFRLEDGQLSTTIPSPIIDDTAAELSEVFLVRLSSVTLDSNENGDVPPTIGTNSQAQVTILPNDNPEGILTFLQTSVNVTEGVGDVVLTVRRNQGRVGRVSTVVLITGLGATLDQDFTGTNLEEIVFVSGDFEENVVISIVDDSLPELNEAFCISLILPEGGAVIGDIPEVCVTILLNDDAYGQFSFDSNSLAVSIEEAGDITTSENVAELRVIRSGGVNGEVSLPFELEQSGRADLSLSPTSGNLVFAENQDFAFIEVTAVRDDIPELDETYTVYLLDPDTLGDLSDINHSANVTIRANQNPHGLLEVFPVDSDASELAIEESSRYIELEIRRSFGTFGEVMVTLESVEGEAVSPSGDSLSFSATQFLDTTSAEKWHQFSRAGKHYLFLASNSVTGDSVLFEWRGAFVPVQNFSTVGATAAAFLSVNGRDIVVVSNSGTSGSRELNSTVYEFTDSGFLEEIQSIATVGASDIVSFEAPNGDWYIVIASREDSEGSPNVDSVVMRWSEGSFVPFQSLETIGASAVEVLSIGDTHYLAFSSFTDTRSPVYAWRDGGFRLDHHVDTQQATDVETASIDGNLWLSIASGSLGVSLFQWSSEEGIFVYNSSLSSAGALRVESVSRADFLLVTNSNRSGQLFNLTDWTEQQGLQLPVARHLYPFSLGSNTTYIASAINSVTEQSSIGQLREIDTTADFYPRSSVLTFAPGQTYHRVVVEIIDDSTPELDEQFRVQLSQPVGGAVLGTRSSLNITILSNDDAHGLIGFAEGLLAVTAPETESGSEVVLRVVRERGTFGQLRINWQVTGDHNNGELTPSSGEVFFGDDASEATITVTIHPDVLPELDEVTVIELTEITENGVPPGFDSSRGARLIPGRTQSFITVQANDAPHGVLVWSTDRVTAMEQDNTDSAVRLTILREFGSIGAILISYSTFTDMSVPIEDQATAGIDYLPTSSSVTMADNVTSTTVMITILHDNEPELLESFVVSLTNVTLVDEADRQGSTSNSPRISSDQATVFVEITENDNSRGLIEFVVMEVSVDEDIGSIELYVMRNSGTFGNVGVDFNITGVTATGDDYSPSSGTVLFEMDVNSQTITIDIINDSEAELEEIFIITLVNPQNGAAIGNLDSVTVTINRNDDINGVFSFDIVLLLLPESEGPDDTNGVATLTVLRSRSTVGEVTVYWEVSEEGRMDLQPTSGNLTFREMETEHSFQVRAVDDGLPELFETFVVALVSTEGGGRIVEPSEARIAIQASDDPNGVVGFDSYPNGIIINEGDLLTFRILRSSGLNGEVTATWQITPSDTAVFTTTSTIVTFADGQSEAVITVQTISDDIPETARLFLLEIVATGLAAVNESLSQVDVIVTASDDPHGVVEFAPPSAVAIEESSITLSVPIERLGGIVGDLRVNFSVLPSSTATGLEDYTIHNQSIVIADNFGSGELFVTINDDMFPELSETLSLSLTSVELTHNINGGRDFEFLGDPAAIDQYPRLGTITDYTVTILENDDPYGVVSLTTSTLVATEGEKAVLTIERTGGEFGLVILTVTIASGGADASDYTDISGTRVQLFQGESSANITISITQDSVPELQEEFVVSISLSPSSSPAILGAVTSATIIIDSSDSPHGQLGFEDPLVYSQPNPTSLPHSLTLEVERMGGSIGQTQVEWEVSGPYPGQEMSDISPVGGTLVLQNGQSGGTIVLNILPSNGDEEEKTFTVYLQSASNDVTIDPTRQSVAITIAQRGMPYGTIGFFGDVIQLHKVDEGVGSQSVVFPIARSAPALGDVQVSFTVTGDTDPSLDVFPTTGTIHFASGLSQVDFSLEILDDADPELEETFTVILSQPTGGAMLDLLAVRSTFTIRANDAPYGLFTIVEPSIVVDQTVFSEISRNFLYTIVRENGRIGDVLLNVVTTYTPDPTTEYVEDFSTVLVDGRFEQQVVLPVASGAYIAPGSVFNVTITDATLQGMEAQEGSGPETSGPTEYVVTEDVANALIGFDSSSLAATINDAATEGSDVALTVVRRGALGTVMVYWTTGLPNSLVANGSITPNQGSFQMNPTDTLTQLFLTATPRDPHGVREVFAVQLSVEPVVPLTLPAEVDPATRTALLEPSGVVQLSSTAFSGVESTGNIQVTVQRYYGSTGDIQVFGISAVVDNSSIPANQEAALLNIDFTVSLVQVTIPDGSTSGTLSVPVLDNQESSPLKVFSFTLTSVAGGILNTGIGTSPRLSTTGSLTALLTIIDDEAGAGLFRLQPTSDTVQEESRRVSFSISREGGSQGRVIVVMQTLEGNAEAVDGESATDGVDYIGLTPQEVVFEDGDATTKTFSISVIDDTEPELAEQFTVVLSNPPGGSALIDPEADTTVVTIAASDSPGGVFSLSPTTITLSEETAPTGIITVQRTGGMLTQVTVEWEALYTDGQIHDTAINSILGVDRALLTFPVGVTSVDINLTLQLNSVPASGEMFTIRIQSDDAGIEFTSPTEATVTVQAKQSSLFQITAADIKKVVTQSGGVTVGVERVNGTQLTATMKYATVELTGTITIGQLTLQPAQFGVHYTVTSGSLTFSTSVTAGDIAINIINPEDTLPLAFNVTISTSELHSVRNSVATIVLYAPGPLSRLIDIYFNTLESTTVKQLESVSNSLYKLLTEGTLVGSTVQFVNGEEQLQFDITQYIISEVISRASSRYTDTLTGNMSDIFQRVLADETFSRRSEFIQTMQSFAYSLLDGAECTVDVPVEKTFSRLLFHLEAQRLPPSLLAQRRLTASRNSDDDFVKFPVDSIFPGNSLSGVECVDVHYIELVEERLLLEPTLNSKVLSVGIRGQSTQTQSPVTYRIYTDTNVMPSERDCLIWNRTLKSWDNNICKAITSRILPQRNNYVECECFRLGEFAVVSDVETGYGWTLSGGLVAAFVVIVMMLVIAVHGCYFQRTQLVTRIFIMLCVSVLLYQLMLVVSVFASDQSNTTESGCTAIAIVLHFTVIFQYVWILAVAVSLWMNFMGITDGKEPLVIYTIVCSVVAILWTVSTILIGQFGLNGLNFSDMYGLAGDFCFTPELSVSLVSTLLPVVLAMLATFAFFSHSCIYWSRWEDFHNMYLDSFNKTEIPLLLVFFVLVFLSSTAAYVHVYVREAYTFGIFVTLEFFQGLYTLIVYVFLSWHTLTRKHKKYGIDDEVEPLTVPGEPDYLGSMSTLASSTRRLNIRQEEEGYQETKSREGLPSDSDEDSSLSSEGAPVIPLSLRYVPSEEPSLEGDDSQLDDLMFMLKTQNLPQDEETSLLFPESPHKPTASEHLELRRISIADTHL